MRGRRITRRRFLQQAAVASAGTYGLGVGKTTNGADSIPADGDRESAQVHTVLGPVAPDRLGVALMHEHMPIVDWSELYETPAADFGPLRQRMLDAAAQQLGAFHDCLAQEDGPGAVVECTPIRVGRYPQLLVEVARRVPVHLVAATGFWCEAMAPQHPWAVRLSLEKNGVERIAELYIREIRQGMEDPAGEWGRRFTDIRAGVIKAATSTYLRPSERRCHEAAALA
ncbi:MAG: hypothetical protein ACOC46_03125, partial [Pirellulales bacterium]